MVPERIPVLGSQPAGDVSHKLGGRLPLLSARPAITLATLKRTATNFAAWWTEARRVWAVYLRLLPDSVATAIWTQAFCAWVSTLTTRLPSHPDSSVGHVNTELNWTGLEFWIRVFQLGRPLSKNWSSLTPVDEFHWNTCVQHSKIHVSSVQFSSCHLNEAQEMFPVLVMKVSNCPEKVSVKRSKVKATSC